MTADPPLVSVVVLVYGTASSLPSCLDSLLSQTLYDIEIITVNDASPDASQEIIESYAARDARLKPLINAENMNLYETRRRGFAAATGIYVATCDSDDNMPSQALERLYKTALITGADFVHGQTRKFVGNCLQGLNYSALPFRVSTGADFVRSILRHGRGLSVWGKLYRRKIIESALTDLPVGKHLFLAEDLLYSFFIGLKTGCYAALPEVVYHYCCPEGSYFRNSERWRQNITDLFEVLAILKKHINTGQVPQDYHGLLDSLIQRYFLMLIFYISNELDCAALKCFLLEKISSLFQEFDSKLLSVQPFWLGRMGFALERFWRDLRMVRDAYECHIILRRYFSVLKRDTGLRFV